MPPARKGAAARSSGVRARSGLSFADKICLAWFALDAFTHLIIEGSYVAIALGPTAHKSSSPFAAIWREYGKADLRWAVRDPTVISLELLTVFVAGPAAAAVAYAIVAQKPWRHPMQALLSLAELYGGWMTFAPEWVDGNPNLRTDNALYLWVYLVFMNGVWVVIPGVLLADSWAHLVGACERAKTATGSGLADAWWYACAGTLAAYALLVPAICGAIALGWL